MSGKKSLKTLSKTTQTASVGTSGTSLSEQYNVIKKDLLKLREDLSKGYDLTKGLIERKGFINELLKVK